VIDRTEGYERALALLTECASPAGFIASPRGEYNYRRVWSRDGVVMGLAGLTTGEAGLLETFRGTLEILADNQGPHGEIPSNVDPDSGRVSYGGTTGRVDAPLWFVIGCIEYIRHTRDLRFARRMHPVLERTRAVLGAWEFNNRGLIFVPPAGDWADEFVHSGYVLYDQLLYLRAQAGMAELHQALHGSSDHELLGQVDRLRHLIEANYWLEADGDGSPLPPPDVYHEVIYERAHEAAEHCADRYWAPFFSPFGYGYRFDALANVLVSLFGVATDDRRQRVDRYIAEEIRPEELAVLPAFYPVVTPVDKGWDDLQASFSQVFRNEPHQYQNGGLWPMITGYYVADLASRGKNDLAGEYLDGINAANALPTDGEEWSFPEFVDGAAFTPGGTRCLGWSAAAAVIGHQALRGKSPFGADPLQLDHLQEGPTANEA
jgi:glycogen debranching enzyme